MKKDNDIKFRVVITFFEGLIASILASIPYLKENPTKETIKIVFITGICMGISGVINLAKSIYDNKVDKVKVENEESNENKIQ